MLSWSFYHDRRGHTSLRAAWTLGCMLCMAPLHERGYGSWSAERGAYRDQEEGHDGLPPPQLPPGRGNALQVCEAPRTHASAHSCVREQPALRARELCHSPGCARLCHEASRAVLCAHMECQMQACLVLLEGWPMLRPRLNESPEDGAQQLRQHVEAPAAPGCVPSQTVGQCHRRVHMPAGHIRCCIDCSRQPRFYNISLKALTRLLLMAYAPHCIIQKWHAEPCWVRLGSPGCEGKQVGPCNTGYGSHAASSQ